MVWSGKFLIIFRVFVAGAVSITLFACGQTKNQSQEQQLPTSQIKSGNANPAIKLLLE